jgi:hypothetical protein
VKIKPTNWEEESVSMVSGDNLAPWIEAEIERFETKGILD